PARAHGKRRSTRAARARARTIVALPVCKTRRWHRRYRELQFVLVGIIERALQRRTRAGVRRGIMQPVYALHRRRHATHLPLASITITRRSILALAGVFTTKQETHEAACLI